MTIRGILFDKDGTLVDFYAMWIPAYEEAANHAITRMGRPDLRDRLLVAGGFDPTTRRVTAGSVLASGTNQEIVEAWADAAGAAWIAELEGGVHAIFHDHSTRPPLATTPLAPVFEALKARGLFIGVATMDTHAAAEAALEHLGVRHHVDAVVGSDDVAAPKPAPDMVHAFARAVGIEPASVVMVGDSTIDLMMGRAAGVAKTVGVLTGPSTRADLEADHVLGSIAELPAAIAEAAANRSD